MSEARIPLARPRVGEDEAEALRRVLESDVLSRGEALTGFEADLAALAGTRFGIGVNSGTSALQIALEALGIGAGDEVITVSYTFIGTLNAIVRCGAQPVLVDIDPSTSNIDPAQIEAAITERTRAILVVHLFGRPAPMDAIRSRVEGRQIAIVEDACEAIGARWQGRPVGGLGDAGTFGFYPNKPIATGEGGMITVNDAELQTRCRQLRNQGLDPVTGTRHPCRAGLSARLSELQAAVGRVQVRRLDASLTERARIAERYIERLGDHEGLELPAPAADGDTISWFTFPLRVSDRATRDRVRAALAKRGIEAGIYFEPAHRFPPYDRSSLRHSLHQTETIGHRGLALPLFPGLAEDDQDRVCDAVRAAV
ncbi:DegT/DnrJ/EryC1/StrS aminotransferase family protein [Halomonas denitrificans]|nr:DegT/DnrJ/EryC1/StrS family aminotransferase [Halomonas denitrificans]